MTAATSTCTVCGEHEPDARLLSECFECGGRYHLNPYANEPGRDCGDAMLGPTMGVYYYCDPCLARISAEHGSESEADELLRAMQAGGMRVPGPGPSEPRAHDAPLDASAEHLPERPQRPVRRRRYRRIDRP